MPLFENERTMSLKKQLLMLPLIAVAATGCVQSDSPIVILNRHYVTPDCEVDESVYIPSGAFDLSVGGSYSGVFAIESNFQALATDVDGEIVAGPDQNDFVSERIDITYSSPSGAAVPDAVSIPYYVTVRAGSGADEGTIGVNLLPQAARVALAGVGQEGVSIVAEFQLHGRLRSGRPVSSNTVAYPIHVFESGFVPSCPHGYVPMGACNTIGGHDGIPIVCEEAPTTP